MKVAYRSKNEIVHDQIQAAIISGEYKPGSRLVIDQLAVELGVSQIPLREAMRALEADGFVTIEPYSGATVTDLNADFLLEVFELLKNIEVMCSKIACCRMSDEELQTLEDLILSMDRLVADPDGWSAKNKELHLYICDCSHSILSKKIMEKVLAHWDRLRQHYLQDVFAQRIIHAQREHHEILSAFRQRNPETLEQAIVRHNQNGLQGYLKHLRDNGLLTNEKEGCP